MGSGSGRRQQRSARRNCPDLVTTRMTPSSLHTKASPWARGCRNAKLATNLVLGTMTTLVCNLFRSMPPSLQTTPLFYNFSTGHLLQTSWRSLCAPLMVVYELDPYCNSTQMSRVHKHKLTRKSWSVTSASIRYPVLQRSIRPLLPSDTCTSLQDYPFESTGLVAAPGAGQCAHSCGPYVCCLSQLTSSQPSRTQ